MKTEPWFDKLVKVATCTDDGYEALVDEICSGPRTVSTPAFDLSREPEQPREYWKFVARLMAKNRELKAFYVQLAAQQEILSFRTRFVYHPAFRWPDLEGVATGAGDLPGVGGGPA